MRNGTEAAPPSTPSNTLPSPPTTALALFEKQEEYTSLRHNVALSMLFVCPALMLLPPRKLDVYTFGLGFAWVFCANEVTKNRTGGVDLMTLIATKGQARAVEVEGVKPRQGGWMGESVVRREVEEEKGEEREGIYDQIVGAVWDVWQQRGKEGGVTVEEEERMEEEGLRERVERLMREKDEARRK